MRRPSNGCAEALPSVAAPGSGLTWASLWPARPWPAPGVRRFRRPGCACQALRLAGATKLGVLQLVAVQATALLLAERGQVEQAVELHCLVSRYPAVANSQWCHDVCGKHIAAAAAALEPQALSAAQARGRARDLQATVEELAAEWSSAPDHASPVAPDARDLQTLAA